MKKIMNLLIICMLAIGMVGCNGYKVKNKDVYNKGYYEYAVADGVDSINNKYGYRGVVSHVVDSIVATGNPEDRFDSDGNYLYTIEKEDYLDYEYGKLQFAIDKTKEEKEKDLYYIFENGVMEVTGEMTKEQKRIIKKYNKAYVECYDEILDLLKEIESRYGKEDIPWEYWDKVQEIFDKQELILESYAEEMSGTVNVKILKELLD